MPDDTEDTTHRRSILAAVGTIPLMSIGSRGRSTRGATDTGGGGGGGKEVPDRFYSDGPPERTGTTISYPSDGHASIEDAAHSLSSGDTLYIESGTYNETVSLNSDSISDSITIRSDLELTFDSDGAASVAQEGATISASGVVFETDPSPNGGGETLTTSHEAGAEELSISDVSPFSVGDVITVEEATRPYGVPASGGASGASTTREHCQISSIDTTNDTLTLEDPLWLPYPNTSATDVSVVDFTIDDFHLSGIRFSGDQAVDECPVRLRGIKNGWYDNLLAKNVGSDHLLFARHNFRSRFNRCHVQNGGQRGISIYDYCTDTAMTTVSGDNFNRYVVRFAPSSKSSAGGYVDGVCGTNLSGRSATDVHRGGFHVDFNDVTAIGTGTIAARSRHLTMDNFEKRGGNSPDIIFAQRPYDVTISNGTIHSKTSTGYVFRFFLRSESENVYGADRFDHILIEDVDIEDYGPAITEIGEFRGDQEGDDLTFRNVTYGGTQLTESDVTSWPGYDDVTITNLTVE